MLSYHLYSINPKTLNSVMLDTGSAGEMRRLMATRPANDDKKEPIKYAIYDENGVFHRSTYGGGANPHDWKIGYNVRRRHAGLSGVKFGK